MSKNYTAPEHLSITCDVKMGMFCDAKPCKCEIGSKEFELKMNKLLADPSQSPDEFLDNFMKFFGDVI